MNRAGSRFYTIWLQAQFAERIGEALSSNVGEQWGLRDFPSVESVPKYTRGRMLLGVGDFVHLRDRHVVRAPVRSEGVEHPCKPDNLRMRQIQSLTTGGRKSYKLNAGRTVPDVPYGQCATKLGTEREVHASSETVLSLAIRSMVKHEIDYKS
jgi:hypothetical protein